jgi:hypothetical protein
MEMPVCRKCGEPHWRFKRCAGQPEKQPVRQPVPVFYSHADRRPGSRLTTLDQTASNTFRRKRDPS